MTTPGGSSPDGAFVLGGRFGQDITEASARATMRGDKLKGFERAQTGFAGIFNAINSWLTNLNAVVDEQVTQAGEITDGLTDLENRVELLEGGAVTVRTFAFNSTWTKPPGLIRLGVAVEGGGSAGRTGSTVAVGTGGTGGLSGGYRYQWFELPAIENDIADTVEVVVGAGGSTPSQIGGVSRFGPHLQSVPGIGAILGVEGAILSNSATGDGGHGGNGSNGTTGEGPTGGEAGGSSAFAAGGAGGSTAGSRAGSNGQSAVTSPVARGNGGGGGGGGGTQVAATVGGRGGDGGFPAGPGGGGGGRGHGLGSTDGAGGLGADGRVTVIEYTRPS
ncbi:glycine-rich domain-containing protein [Rhodococcoides fascians]|uniref:glycine-rich domain-containing protein n=1 Tax=Rhodococcoides fascians TaxID=1828 RepID=UPI0012D2EF2F|nr:hypothetical protein [Rhodococcus fascians]